MGVAAAIVHYSLAVFTVAVLGFPPQAGNVAGYTVALLVSYVGQARFTFADSARHRLSFVRFSATSLLAFAINFVAYAALLRWTSLDYRVALLLVLGGVAGFTYLVLNKWVFPHGRSSP